MKVTDVQTNVEKSRKMNGFYIHTSFFQCRKWGRILSRRAPTRFVFWVAGCRLLVSFCLAETVSGWRRQRQVCYVETAIQHNCRILRNAASMADQSKTLIIPSPRSHLCERETGNIKAHQLTYRKWLQGDVIQRKLPIVCFPIPLLRVLCTLQSFGTDFWQPVTVTYTSLNIFRNIVSVSANCLFSDYFHHHN